MKRPFVSRRPIGPFATINTNYTEYLARVHLQGDVSEHPEHNAQFANFVRGAFQEHQIGFGSYKGWTPESPFKGDVYLCRARIGADDNLPTGSRLDSIIRHINDKVVGLATPEFRVEDIEFKET